MVAKVQINKSHKFKPRNLEVTYKTCCNKSLVKRPLTHISIHIHVNAAKVCMHTHTHATSTAILSLALSVTEAMTMLILKSLNLTCSGHQCHQKCRQETMTFHWLSLLQTQFFLFHEAQRAKFLVMCDDLCTKMIEINNR